MAISEINSFGQSTKGSFGINGIGQNAVKLANKNILFFSLIKEKRVCVLRCKWEENALTGKRNRSALILGLLYSDKYVFKND